jgi:hypothetical protein
VPITDLLDNRQAFDLLKAGMLRDEWIGRRIVGLSFESDILIRRRVEVEVNLTEIPSPVVLDDKLYVPITDVDRAGQQNLVCEDGATRLYTLGRTDERTLTAMGLVWTLEPRVDIATINFSLVDCCHYHLDSSYLAKVPDGWDEWLAIVRNDSDFADVLADYEKQRLVIGVLRGLRHRDNPTRVSYSTSEVLRVERSGWWRTARALFSSRDPNKSVFAAWDQLGAVGGNWQGVQADGTATGIERVSSNAGAPRGFYRKAWSRPWLLSDTYVVNIDLSELLESRTLNVSMEVPSGVYIDSAILRIFHFNDHTSSILFIKDNDAHPQQANLHFSRTLLGIPDDPEDYLQSQLRLILRPSYHNGLRSGRNIIFASAVISWLVTIILAWPAAGWDCVEPLCRLPSVTSFDRNSVVTLLIAAPSVAVGVYLRPGPEALITKRIQGAYRTRLALSGALSFALALVAAIEFSDGAVFAIAAVTIAILHSMLFFSTQRSARRSHKATKRE